VLRNWRTTDRVKGNEWPKNLLLDFCLCERMLIQAEAEEEEVEEDEVVEVEVEVEEATGEEEAIGAEEDEGEEEGVAAEAGVETGEAEGADPREAHLSNDGKDKRKASQLANHLHVVFSLQQILPFLVLFFLLLFICVPARTRTRANKFNGSSRCVPCFPCGSSGMSEGEGKE